MLVREKLLTPAWYNPKTRKGQAYGWETAIMHLSPHSSSGHNVCRFSTPGCRASCLNYSGRGQMQQTQIARVRRTQLFFMDREKFFQDLRHEIIAHVRRARRIDRRAAVRLNGTSDIPWEITYAPDSGVSIIEAFPEVQFYDYTKSAMRVYQYVDGQMPSNYGLVYSRSESIVSHKHALSLLEAGANVAVVFYPTLPQQWEGFPVLDGDAHDLRFLEPKGHVVGLKAKGKKAKHDLSGFVVQTYAHSERIAA